MNRFLVLVIVIILPIAISSYKEEEDTPVLSMGKNYSLEWQINDVSKSNAQVLISNNKDKSNAYYMDLEDYIIGVVAGEMPASFNEEALKAQAVAARTYALYKMKNIKNYVLATSVSDQVYLSIDDMKKKWGSDFDYYYNRVKRAVLETEGEILTYNDEVIIAYYFAISNGYTDDGATVFNDDKAYLKSVDSLWDKNYNAYSSSAIMAKSTFCSCLNISCNTINISNIVRSDNNYVREITINGKKFTGLDIFNKLSLKSTDFEIIDLGDKIKVNTYGFGHSVGMSQYGAQGMASSGYNYQDILKHYYINTELNKI